MKTEKNDLIWKVFYYDRNNKEITEYNIFDLYGFRYYIRKETKNCETKEAFADIVNIYLMHFFWAKCEWEIILSPWIAKGENEKRKIDVYQQVMLNWDIFIDYLWERRKLV